jgi:Resolvase, N terminal domain
MEQEVPLENRATKRRVSTRTDKRDDDARQRKRQDVENQRRQLREFCDRRGWQIVDEYADEESGAKSDRAGSTCSWHTAAPHVLRNQGVFPDAVLPILAAIAKQERIRSERTRPHPRKRAPTATDWRP